MDGDHKAWEKQIPPNVEIEWNFVWVLKEAERDSRLGKRLPSPKHNEIWSQDRRPKPKDSVAVQYFETQAALAAPGEAVAEFKEWFYSFGDIHSKIAI